LKEEKLKTEFVTFVPETLNDGWIISSPYDEQMDEKKLEDIYRYFHENNDLWQVRSLLVFKNDKLISESYTKSESDKTEPAAIWSCTKQVLGLLTGIAIDSGFIVSTDDKISYYLPQIVDNFPDKADISIDNLLTMQSGIAFENDGFNGQSAQLLRQIPDNSLNFVLSLQMQNPQGTVFNYNDGDPHIISAIIQKQTGATVKDWANTVLFSQLNIKNWDWIVYKDNITMGAFGILMTPRELAKIGQCILNKGMWNGKRIVSEEWIERMTSVEVEHTNVGKSFGYYWWIDIERDIVFMYGHGGQFVFIDSGKNLMVVITSEPNTQGKYMFSLEKSLEVFDMIKETIYE
jgi:CubicO group peptidase (beta-lactamase class C family)